MNESPRRTPETANGEQEIVRHEKPEEIPGQAPGKALTPEARRALMEAEARRQAAPVAPLPTEIGGRREGEEATRYGDWEKKGIAVDF